MSAHFRNNHLVNLFLKYISTNKQPKLTGRARKRNLKKTPNETKRSKTMRKKERQTEIRQNKKKTADESNKCASHKKSPNADKYRTEF